MDKSRSALSPAAAGSKNLRGLAPKPQSKAEWLLGQYWPDMPTMPVDAEVMASAPEGLTGEWPETDEDLVF